MEKVSRVKALHQKIFQIEKGHFPLLRRRNVLKNSLDLELTDLYHKELLIKIMI